MNVTSLAPPHAEQASFGTDPVLLVRGKAAWQNVGKDPENPLRETYPRAPVNEAYPSWFILVWPEPIALSALRLTSSADEVKFYAFTGGVGKNPAVASDNQWRRLQVGEQLRNGAEQDSVIRPKDRHQPVEWL